MIARFPNVSCSQCGRDFGPGDHGFSSCDQHRPKPPSDSQVIAAMSKYGGSFAIGLAIAARSADSENLRKIKHAWPEYWEQYERLAMRDIERATAPVTFTEEYPRWVMVDAAAFQGDQNAAKLGRLYRCEATHINEVGQVYVAHGAPHACYISPRFIQREGVAK